MKKRPLWGCTWMRIVFPPLASTAFDGQVYLVLDEFSCIISLETSNTIDSRLSLPLYRDKRESTWCHRTASVCCVQEMEENLLNAHAQLAWHVIYRWFSVINFSDDSAFDGSTRFTLVLCKINLHNTTYWSCVWVFWASRIAQVTGGNISWS